MAAVIPFPGASWNKSATAMGMAADSLQHYATRFCQYAGGAAGPGHMGLSLKDYSVPIYNTSITPPNTSVRVYQATWSQSSGNVFSNCKIGDTIPWNFAWKPGTGSDRIIIVEDPKTEKVYYIWCCYEPLSAGWDWFGPNNMNGFNQTADSNKIVVGAMGVSKNIYSTAWKQNLERGMGTSKRMLITTADEVASGDIGHALEMTIANTTFAVYPGVAGRDYFYPATRAEWDIKKAPYRSSKPDLDVTHQIPEGMRFALKITDSEIETFLDLKKLSGPFRNTVKVFIYALRDYGWIVAETGAWGCYIETSGIVGPDKSKWVSLGVDEKNIVAQTEVLRGLLTPERVYVVKAPLYPGT